VNGEWLKSSRSVIAGRANIYYIVTMKITKTYVSDIIGISIGESHGRND